MPNSHLRAAMPVLLLALFAAMAAAQTITGTLVGSVVDPSGAAVTNAEVSVVQKATGAKRTVKTNEQGDFLIGSLQPGEYTLSVTSAGFKTLQRTGIVLSSAETLPVGKLTMEIGAVSDQISVTAEGAAV